MAHGICSEGRQPNSADSPYAASKQPSTCSLIAIHKVLKFPMNIISPSNAYCPGNCCNRVIRSRYLRTDRQEAAIQGGGRAEKSYIHARD